MKKTIKLILIFVSTAVLLLVLFTSLFTNNYKGDYEKRKSCQNNPLNYSFPVYLDTFEVEEVNNSKVYVINSKGAVVDSTIIRLSGEKRTSSPATYEFEKNISTKHTWKIFINKKFGNSPEHIIITNIKTKAAQERTMTGHIIMCYIYEWEVNGKKYINSNYVEGNQKFILGQ
ncbi:hypothetical protein CHU92_00345 [Flavobacterium cyanobacteriorum]|uniref:Uncharacterized protein n=1 Tax=Flavobacterium cyanobacteriorum TaxID=2022802 RepID=A0A256A6A1_9FLAO|nr:hypothetical protein [Flavobacterium cyanobacteriorum]OYQ49286.1 hypothetical protein CHU92_00345 [Flavobacterium cyanobacteriorum]